MTKFIFLTIANSVFGYAALVILARAAGIAADQLEFLNRIIDALPETGFVDSKKFYESP